MINLYGSTFVADAIGMERAALSNHLSRNFDDVPIPVAVLRESVGRWKHPRYLWDDDGLIAWREWKAKRDGNKVETLTAKAERLRAELAAVEARLPNGN